MTRRRVRAAPFLTVTACRGLVRAVSVSSTSSLVLAVFRRRLSTLSFVLTPPSLRPSVHPSFHPFTCPDLILHLRSSPFTSSCDDLVQPKTNEFKLYSYILRTFPSLSSPKLTPCLSASRADPTPPSSQETPQCTISVIGSARTVDRSTVFSTSRSTSPIRVYHIASSSLGGRGGERRGRSGR